MTSYVGIVEALYAAVTLEPQRWHDTAFSEWVEAVVEGEPPTSAEARQVRRALRMAQKMQRFWAAADESARTEPDWRARVDSSAGIPAWRPLLALAEIELDRAPSEESFAAVAALFRLVHGAEFAGGLGFDAWLRSDASGARTV